jgi:hypothetical protein
MHIYCYSFNQNGNYIDQNIISHIYEKISDINPRPELLVLGFQETRFGFEYYWAGLPLQKEYQLIHKIRMNGIGNVGIRGLGLYVLKLKKSELAMDFVEENWVRYNYQYFGKGAISILLRVGSKRFLFINTHMPYSESWEGGGIKERVDSLNVMFEYIISKTVFDYIFIMGDFNFRIHLKTRNKYADDLKMVDDPETFELYFRNKCWKILHMSDELYLLNRFYSNFLTNLNQNEKHGAEYGYVLEIPLIPFYGHMLDKFNFPPTYKLITPRQEILESSDEHLHLEKFYDRWKTDRIPSWCDRILTVNHTCVSRIIYDCCDSPLVMNSDHLPVFSMFEVRGGGD